MQVGMAAGAAKTLSGQELGQEGQSLRRKG